MATQEQLLQAMHFWVSNLHSLQQPVNPKLFTTMLAQNQAQIMRQYLEDEARSDREQVTKAPDKFKNVSGFKVFAEALETYLSQLYGSGCVPLSYVIWREVIALPNAVYQTEQARSIALAPLNGASYQQDIARVYGIIKQLVLKGPGRTFILCFDLAADGRGAWLALKAHYEGKGFRNCNVEDVYATLDYLMYEGNKKGLTFEKIIERHVECYLELSWFDESRPTNWQQQNSK
jgi:hypothetical protein